METMHMRTSSTSGHGYNNNHLNNFEADIDNINDSLDVNNANEAATRNFLQEYYSKAMYRCTSRLSVATKQTITSSEGRVNSINSLAVVISFIAAVQSTIILLTITGDGTALARTANTIAFLGLILDVTGALTGLAHAFHLQHVIKDQTQILGVISEFDTDITSIREWLKGQLQSRRSNSHSRADHHNIFHAFPIEDTLRRAAERMQSFYEEDARRQEWSSVTELFQLAAQSRTLGAGRSREVAEFGATPIRAMVLGSLCLLVSTILLAARDLHRETWITCLVVGLVVYEASMLASIRQKVLDHFKGRIRGQVESSVSNT